MLDFLGSSIYLCLRSKRNGWEHATLRIEGGVAHERARAADNGLHEVRAVIL